MGHFIKKLTLVGFLAAILGSTAPVFADGAGLFCLDDLGHKHQTHWSNITPAHWPSDDGIGWDWEDLLWLNGEFTQLIGLDDTVFFIHRNDNNDNEKLLEFDSDDKAREFCLKLRKICTDEWGREFFFDVQAEDSLGDNIAMIYVFSEGRPVPCSGPAH